MQEAETTMQQQLPVESRLRLALERREREAVEAAWFRQVPARRPNGLRVVVGLSLVRFGHRLAADSPLQPMTPA